MCSAIQKKIVELQTNLFLFLLINFAPPPLSQILDPPLQSHAMYEYEIMEDVINLKRLGGHDHFKTILNSFKTELCIKI